MRTVLRKIHVPPPTLEQTIRTIIAPSTASRLEWWIYPEIANASTGLTNPRRSRASSKKMVWKLAIACDGNMVIDKSYVERDEVKSSCLCRILQKWGYLYEFKSKGGF
jgi:hypothetical protein